MNKAIALFDIGKGSIDDGMNILGAHIDSPRLDAKQNPIYEKDCITYLNTHYYGGIKKYQWVTIPLAVHGVVCKADGTVIQVNIGEDADDPVFCISDILPHLAQEQMKKTGAEIIKGEDLDVIFGLRIPSENDGKTDDEDGKDSGKKKKGKADGKKAILELLKKKYNIEADDFKSAELEIVPAGAARDCGLDCSMILGYGQDDRSCAFASVSAMLESSAGKRTNCCVCVDKEEIGSVGATGMHSRFFEDIVAEIIYKMGNYNDIYVYHCSKTNYHLYNQLNRIRNCISY